MGKTELLIILYMWLWGTQECTLHDLFILDRHGHAGLKVAYWLACWA